MCISQSLPFLCFQFHKFGGEGDTEDFIVVGDDTLQVNLQQVDGDISPFHSSERYSGCPQIDTYNIVCILMGQMDRDEGLGLLFQACGKCIEGAV